MRMIALGRRGDGRGFALAGLETARCDTPQDAAALMAQFAGDPTIGLLLVPLWVEEMAPAAIARIRARKRAPVVLVLPA